MRNSVLLPHPDGPTTQTNSPSTIFRSTLLSACTLPLEAVTYVLLTLRISMSGRPRCAPPSRAACSVATTFLLFPAVRLQRVPTVPPPRFPHGSLRFLPR